MSDSDEFDVHIRTRSNEEEEYVRPAIRRYLWRLRSMPCWKLIDGKISLILNLVREDEQGTLRKLRFARSSNDTKHSSCIWTEKKDSETGSESDSGSDSSDDQESSSSDDDESEDDVEDEDAALLTREVDTQILKTIAAIQSKDPRVYDSNEKFFTEEDMERAQKAWEEKKKEARKAGKEYTLKDYQREVLLEHGGHVNEENQPKVKTYHEEQEELKDAFKSAAAEAVESEDEEGDNLLVKREKTAEEIEKEEKEYRDFLLESIAVSLE